MNKKNKKLAIIIICAVVVLAVAGVAIWLITKNNGGGNGSNGSGESSSQTNNNARVTASELTTGKVSDEISYGDFSAMQTLAKAIQNGKKTGSIVSIDGVVSHKGKSYSIGENNPEKSGATFIGTVFNIEDSEEYPKDGDRVTIVAKVVEVSSMNFQLVTLKSFVKGR